MDVERILQKLERYAGKLPREALRQAIEQREAVTPHLLEALRFARSHAEDLPEDYSLHTWAMFLLAQFRETQAYPLILDLVDLPSDTLEELHGDGLTEDMSRILASVCGSDTGPIERLAEKPDLDEYARSAALGALVSLVAAGRRSREETLEYFRHLFHTGQGEPGSVFWSGLVNYSTDLYPDSVMEEIRQAYDRQLVDPFYISLEDVEETLAGGKEATLAKLAANPHYRLVEDVLTECDWWACFQPTAPPPPRLPAPALVPHPALGRSTAWPGALAGRPPDVGRKPGRNAPCPCGSGRKYKLCCGK
jgi:hypothetical protein